MYRRKKWSFDDVFKFPLINRQIIFSLSTSTHLNLYFYDVKQPRFSLWKFLYIISSRVIIK